VTLAAPEPALDAALAATWPAAGTRRIGPVTLHDGAGGGKRVSAATLDGPLDPSALAAAEAAMQAEGRAPLFRVRAGQGDLDAWLAARGYATVDPTRFYTAPAAALARPPRPISLFGLWPPLAIQRQLWAEAGIGPARMAIMERTAPPKAAFIARVDNRAAGVGFCALHGTIAMLHALEVLPGVRRKGVGRLMVTGIAHWAQTQGAPTLALAVTEGNVAARALYETLGMRDAGGYHYREAAP
jgi:GNAT superfamily N-acetyltransferase